MELEFDINDHKVKIFFKFSIIRDIGFFDDGLLSISDICRDYIYGRACE